MLALRVAAGCVLLIAVAAPPAGAQSYQGRLRGTVRDGDGVIPSASVELRDDDAGLTRRTLTNEGGEYVFAGMAPGSYSLRVSVAGYRSYERHGLRVGTQTFLTIDVPLDVGDVSEYTVVEAPAPLAATSDGSVSVLLDRQTLETTPAAGRNIFIMASRSPMVLPTGDSQFVRQQDQSNSSLISLGGGPRRNNSYVLDGVPIVDIVNRAAFIPSIAAVEEMRVQLSAYDAEVGRTSGGVFNATARAGTNVWRGSAAYQNRPGWATSRLFFAEKHDISAPETYYHLWSGAVGGPIARNRTFFWASGEGYQSRSLRSSVLRLPTAAERRGDFSGSAATIYDPLTTRRDPDDPTRFIRDPFPHNQIPVDRMDPVALALLRHLPLPTSGTSSAAVAQIVDSANQFTGKLTHNWSPALTTTGLTAWYGSQEPDARFFGGKLFANGADPGEGALIRRVRLLAVNNLWTRSDRTVLALRVGATRFLDDNRPAAFDPSTLGFDPAFLAAVPLAKFPSIAVADYGRGGSFLGDRSQQRATYYSHVVNLSATTLRGRHTVKVGGDYRTTGVSFLNRGGTGSFSFSRDFTLGPDPNAPAAATGDAFAAFLLGYPASGVISTSSPVDVYLHYVSGFVQDDVRLTSRLTLNLGLRYEFETGLRERDDRLAVGWAAAEAFPVQVGGTRPDGSPLTLTGGLVYAGVDGAPHHQGDPNPWQFAPRVGIAFAVSDRSVLRGGYGLFWAPLQGIVANETGTGTRGYNQSTDLLGTSGNPLVPCASCSLGNPYPSGITQPTGNSLGRLTGVGGYVEVVDSRSRQGHLHRYSVELQRQLEHQLIVSAAYLGARGEDLALGGSTGSWISINQLDPRYLALGSALQEDVPNPFFGTPLGVGVLAGPTVTRAQLLRPYPQFDTVNMTRSSLARSRYHAMVLSADRRLSRGWSAGVNYTWSRLTDSQLGESNFFSGGSTIQNAYDVEAEYGLGVLDTPHRVNITGAVELPFGVSVSAVGSYHSGFPVTVQQGLNNTGLLGSNQRPNLVPGVDPLLTRDPSDSWEASCGCIQYLNPAAWAQAAPFTFGNAPRTDGRVRTPGRQLWDLAIQKTVRFAATTLAIRAEVINVFNVADLRGPNVAFGDTSFGQIREAGGFPRLLQLTARVGW